MRQSKVQNSNIVLQVEDTTTAQMNSESAAPQLQSKGFGTPWPRGFRHVPSGAGSPTTHNELAMMVLVVMPTHTGYKPCDADGGVSALVVVH
jgi:hypothetical protein